ADERRIGQSQIDRTAHWIDSPVVRIGGLTLSRTAAPSSAGTLGRVNPRESQGGNRHQRRTAQHSPLPCEALHHLTLQTFLSSSVKKSTSARCNSGCVPYLPLSGS